MTMLELPHPYLVFLGDTPEPMFAKTAFGLRDWAPERCIGEWSCGNTTVTTGLPRLSPRQARERGARSLVIGVANFGGIIQETWLPSLLEALDATAVPDLFAAIVLPLLSTSSGISFGR